MLNKTREKLEKNLKILLEKPEKNKISVTALAETVGISHSTIYNRYSDIATKIQTHNMSVLIANDNSFKDKLTQTKVDKGKLKNENIRLKEDVQKLVSLNAKYEMDNQKLKREVELLEKRVSDLNIKYGDIKLL
ncbi:hypothetical protein WNY51_04280 [Pseudocolwellia sp. AS88]|jgi:hypothetical protein|uniref:hypothetical protein n=1 Tax=Pseudocolwellia sp. AS88 TaxID=3063958 RepID=UPI0026F31E10|nr:hypothetical protein [Pseudocolwellia sp. AS88]MDO7086267.1 hypothetical protein [Pseudocolwellia sp. AS88]